MIHRAVAPLPDGIAAIAQRRHVQGQEVVVAIVASAIVSHSESIGHPERAQQLLDRVIKGLEASPKEVGTHQLAS